MAGPGANVEHAFIASSQVPGSTPAGGPRTAGVPPDSVTPWDFRHSASDPCSAGADDGVEVSGSFDADEQQGRAAFARRAGQGEPTGDEVAAGDEFDPTPLDGLERGPVRVRASGEAGGGFGVSATEDEHALDADAIDALSLAARSERLDSEKSTCRARSHLDEAPLAAIVRLVWDDDENAEVAMQRVRGAAMIGALVTSIPRIVVDDRQLQALELNRLAKLCKRVPIVELSRPRALGKLEDAARIIETMLGNADPAVTTGRAPAAPHDESGRADE